MNEETTKYMVLNATGNPIERAGDEANPYIFHDLITACVFAEAEKKNQEAVSVIKIVELCRQES